MKPTSNGYPTSVQKLSYAVVSIGLCVALSGAAVPTGSGSDALTVDRVSATGRGTLVEVSVPRRLSGAPLAADAFSVGGGTSWVVLAARRLLEGGARIAVFVDGPFDTGAARGVQAALLELAGDLEPTVRLTLAVNGSVLDAGTDRRAFLGVVQRFAPPDPLVTAEGAAMFRQVLVTGDRPAAVLVVTTRSDGTDAAIGATEVVDSPVFVVRIGTAATGGGWLDSLSARTGGGTISTTADQLSAAVHDVELEMLSRYRLVVPDQSSGGGTQLRVAALGIERTVPLAAPSVPRSVTAPPSVSSSVEAPRQIATGAPPQDSTAIWLVVALGLFVLAAAGAAVWLRTRVLPRRRAAMAALEQIRHPDAASAPPIAARAPPVAAPAPAPPFRSSVEPAPRLAEVLLDLTEPRASSALAEADVAARRALTDLVARRLGPGLHVAPLLFNAIESAASAWLVDPAVQVADLVAYLVRRVAGEPVSLRSPTLDHIAVAESHLLAAMASGESTGRVSASLVDAAMDCARQVDSAATDARVALTARAALAAWASLHTALGPVAIVVSPSLAPDDDSSPRRPATSDEAAVTMLRAVEDGARRMLRAERSLTRLRADYLARAASDVRVAAGIDRALEAIVVSVVTGGATVDGRGLDRGVVMAMAREGWLAPVPVASTQIDGREWWIANEAFEYVTSAFADGASHSVPGSRQKEPHHVN